MKRIIAIGVAMMLAIGLAAWGNWDDHDISVEASGDGNVTLVQNLITRQGSLTEIVCIDGNFEETGWWIFSKPGFSSYIDIAPCGAFTEHKTLRDIQGLVYMHEEVKVIQPYYAMGAYVKIEASIPGEPAKVDGLDISECVSVGQFEPWGDGCNTCPIGPDAQVLELDLSVDGYVDDGTFTVGHSGTASWQGCVPWQVKQGGWCLKTITIKNPLWPWIGPKYIEVTIPVEIPGLEYDLTTNNDSKTVDVSQSATIDAGVFYEFGVSSTVLYDTVDLDVHLFDFAWIPSGWVP